MRGIGEIVRFVSETSKVAFPLSRSPWNRGTNGRTPIESARDEKFEHFFLFSFFFQEQNGRWNQCCTRVSISRGSRPFDARKPVFQSVIPTILLETDSISPHGYAYHGLGREEIFEGDIIVKFLFFFFRALILLRT